MLSIRTVARVVTRRAVSCRIRPTALASLATTTTTTSSTRSFHVTAKLLDDNLPYHIVVGLPALSPTMDSGSLAEWYVAEGDAINAGDAVAKIETDKASMDFEAQDDVYVAKLLRQPGDANDLPVGTPIMITVEDEADVAAFKDYVHKADEAAPAVAPAPAPEPPKKENAPPTPAAEPEPAKEAPAAAAPPPAPAAAAAPPAPPAASAGSGQSIAIPWARPTSTTSPLTKSMNKQQEEYMKLYGTTGQKAVVAEE